METKINIENYLQTIGRKLTILFKNNEHSPKILKICYDIEFLEKKLVSNHYKINEFLITARRTNETSNETINHKISEIFENGINFETLKNKVISLINEVESKLPDVDQNLENDISKENNELREVNFSIDQLKNELTKIREAIKNHQIKLELLDETIEKVNDEDCEPLKTQSELTLKENISSSQNESKKDSSNEFTVSESVPKLVVLVDDENELKKMREIVKKLKCDLKPDFCKLEKNKIINRKILQVQETLINVINANKENLDFYFIILILKEYKSVSLDLSVISTNFPNKKLTLKLLIISPKLLNQLVLKNNDLIKSERRSVKKNNVDSKFKSEMENFVQQFYDSDHTDLEIAQKHLSKIEEKLAVQEKEKDELSEQRANEQNKILEQNNFTKEIDEISNDLKRQHSKFGEEISILKEKESDVMNKIEDQVKKRGEIENNVQILMKKFHDQFKDTNTSVVTENQSLISYLKDFQIHLENLDKIKKQIHLLLNKIKDAYNDNSFSLVRDHIERIKNLI